MKTKSRAVIKKQKAPSESFHSHEFPHHKKGQLWYLGITLLLLAFLLLTLQSRDYLMSAVIVAAGIAIFRVSRLEPAVHKVEIDHKGVYWGSRFLPFHKLKAFWVTEAGTSVRAYIDQINFRPQISFDVPASRVEAIIQSLGSHLPYHPHKSEPISDRLSRLLRL